MLSVHHIFSHHLSLRLDSDEHETDADSEVDVDSVETVLDDQVEDDFTVEGIPDDHIED